MRQADDLIPAMKTQNRIDGGIIIIGLGTNGAFSKQDLDSLLRPLDSAKQILLINTRVPRDWEQNVNGMLAKAAPRTRKLRWWIGIQPARIIRNTSGLTVSIWSRKAPRLTPPSSSYQEIKRLS